MDEIVRATWMKVYVQGGLGPRKELKEAGRARWMIWGEKSG